MTSLTPFQRHLRYFASPNSKTSITLLSSLRASLQLGLNFPVSLALAIGIRILYGRFPYSSPVSITSITPAISRPQLADVSASATTSASALDRTAIMKLYESSPTAQRRGAITQLIDRGHLLSFWALAADKRGLVDIEDVQRFQTGEWTGPIIERRKSRVPGKGDILPFWRGGPIGVAAHSWFVGRLFGVEVYLPE